MQALIALIILNIPFYFLVGWLIFDGWSDFRDSIFFFLKPDFWSAFSGELWDDWWAQMKFLVFALLCALIVFGQHKTFGDSVGTFVQRFF